MKRKILLIEPNYKNKYPPMGLMKLSTYYKNLGDDVRFFKGNLTDLVLDDIYEDLKTQLYFNNSTVFWELYKPQIIDFIRKGTVSVFEEIPECTTNPIIMDLFRYYRKFFTHKLYFEPEFRKYDRVGITTLFTFYWDITVETINFAKNLCKKIEDVMVGGVMASILADRVYEATGIYPHEGTLDTPGELDEGNDMIIDTLPLDYSILEEIDYVYPASNGYFAYMTRGCVNKCSFCAVPKLEPMYKQFLPVSEQVKLAEERFGAKRDLLLLDNNVLASKCFNEIIDDIKKAGFAKGDTYLEPNYYEIAVRNLRDGINDRGYIKLCVKQYHRLLSKIKDEDQKEVYELLKENYLLNDYTASKKAIFDTYEKLKPHFETLYSTKPRKRYVDFNQGLDSRLTTTAKMKKMAEIPIFPVRIAFDHWELRDRYKKAIQTTVKCGHTNLSNYILYNFKDKPVDLYRRLKLNVDLCEELGVNIYSFPMKYHPIEDPEYFSNRDYIGENWCRKYIRCIQAVLNSTKGKVGRGKEFFEKAFGKDEEEFFKILYMPEVMIVYRFYYEGLGLTEKWWKAYCRLNEKEKAIINPIIEANDFRDIESKTDRKRILKVLKFYTIQRDDAEKAMKDVEE